MILHLIQVEQCDNPAIQDCLSCLAKEDTIAIISELPLAELQSVISKFAGINTRLKLVGKNASTSGDRNNIDRIDYEQLVALTCTHNKTISWY